MDATGRPGIRSGADIRTAARFMLFWDTDLLEVFEKDEFIGEVTRRDLIRFLAENRDAYDTNVGALLAKVGRIDRLDPRCTEAA